MFAHGDKGEDTPTSSRILWNVVEVVHKAIEHGSTPPQVEDPFWNLKKKTIQYWGGQRATIRASKNAVVLGLSTRIGKCQILEWGFRATIYTSNLLFTQTIY